MANRDWALVVLLGSLWGSSFLFVEILLEHLSPFAIVYVRVSIAAVTLLLFALATRVKFRLGVRDIVNLSVMALLNNVIPFLLITYGQQTTTGGLASILNANASLLTIVIASMIIPYEKLTLQRVAGVLIGLLGVIVAMGYEHVFQFREGDIGKYLILLATLSYALSSIWAKLTLHNLSSVVSAAGMLTISTLILSPYALANYSHTLLDMKLSVLLYAFLLAFLCSVLAYFLYFKILKRAGAGNLLISTIVIPPSSILLNALVLGEAISTAEMLGLIIILIGLLTLDGRVWRKLFRK